MLELENIHNGKTCYIVGKGNSIKKLKNKDFGEGIVITLNQAIEVIEKLKINNIIYSMQKDGASPLIRDKCPCEINGWKTCPHDMVTPKKAILLVHEHESKECLKHYEKRIIFDSEKLGLYMFTESVICAIELAKYMGCNFIKMLGFDSYTNNDNSNIMGKIEDSYPLQRQRIDYYLKSINHEFSSSNR